MFFRTSFAAASSGDWPVQTAGAAPVLVLAAVPPSGVSPSAIAARKGTRGVIRAGYRLSCAVVNARRSLRAGEQRARGGAMSQRPELIAPGSPHRARHGHRPCSETRRALAPAASPLASAAQGGL